MKQRIEYALLNAAGAAVVTYNTEALARQRKADREASGVTVKLAKITTLIEEIA